MARHHPTETLTHPTRVVEVLTRHPMDRVPKAAEAVPRGIARKGRPKAATATATNARKANKVAIPLIHHMAIAE